jgi:hypothetical protein
MLYAFLFFTLWVIILVVLHKYTFRYIDLLYLTFITLVVGSYISFINPGYILFKVNDKETIKFEGFNKIIITDLASHLFIFLFIYFWYYDYYKVKDKNLILNSVLLLFIYFIITTIHLQRLSVETVYNVKIINLLIVFVIASCLYYFI